jgi:hypothetical protein
MSKVKVGDKVQVYALMNPPSDFIGVKTIKHIAPMGSEERMFWFEEGGGAYHPDACVKIEKRDVNG